MVDTDDDDETRLYVAAGLQVSDFCVPRGLEGKHFPLKFPEL